MSIRPAVPPVNPPVQPGDEKCQHCYAIVRVDSLGTLRTVRGGFLAEGFCESMPLVQHKRMPAVAHA